MEIIKKIILMIIIVALYDVIDKLIERFIKNLRKMKGNKENDKE